MFAVPAFYELALTIRRHDIDSVLAPGAVLVSEGSDIDARTGHTFSYKIGANRKSAGQRGSPGLIGIPATIGKGAHSGSGALVAQKEGRNLVKSCVGRVWKIRLILAERNADGPIDRRRLAAGGGCGPRWTGGHVL